MGERDRYYQPQYDRERGRFEYDEPQREHNRESHRARAQPREWEPGREDYRHDPRGRYAGYYDERQYGTRGSDEREQGPRFGAEEEHYRARPSSDWGRPSRSDNYYGSARQERHDRQDQPQRHEESVGHQLREAGHRIAQKVKRVFRGPKGYTRSDERIREDISDRMGEHEYLDCSDVEVNVIKGEVTLTGSVNTRQEKFLAEEIADDVSGVNDVQNHIRVRREQGIKETHGSTETATTSAEASRMRNLRS